MKKKYTTAGSDELCAEQNYARLGNYFDLAVLLTVSSKMYLKKKTNISNQWVLAL